MPVPGVELAVCTVMGAAQAGCRVVDYIEKIKATHQAEKRALLLRARRSDVLEENVRSLERRMADHNLIKDLNMKLEALGKQYDQSRSEVSGLESRINELLEKCATLKLQNEEREAVSKPVLEVKLGASPGRQRGEAPEEAKAKFMAVQMDSVDYAGAIRQLRERANPASQIKAKTSKYRLTHEACSVSDSEGPAAGSNVSLEEMPGCSAQYCRLFSH
eukprot:CAMPEP_0170597680 /NCGR_PEP_ID=MMETSP0224-20130122/15835_1 /TAXON_ID=285029 /ORGANISM="Togula jolla, Strain CCCM 725" /LENGTH=217 /DNA_ID=CAMNT_0010922165 /DNA_START=36 /DNA_END=689 /DNA_ORIENTATION=+